MAGEFGPSAGEMGNPLPETLEAFPGTTIARKKSKTDPYYILGPQALKTGIWGKKPPQAI